MNILFCLIIYIQTNHCENKSITECADDIELIQIASLRIQQIDAE